MASFYQKKITEKALMRFRKEFLNYIYFNHLLVSKKLLKSSKKMLLKRGKKRSIYKAKQKKQEYESIYVN